ncbi:hypothetical protein [Tateyamaria pelophila]|uniref:hypothetical protein n=1 Tax=Tateyamaria pelophila TaxID=328415 RepID=UPI001CBB772D|nr:hypothetical protein [Tateyamaria pelophila]
MNSVTQIRLAEPVSVDHDRLGALYSEMGHAGAEDVVCRAMEELALRMAHCDRLMRSAEYDELRKSARSLIAIAEQIGMDLLARVARDVMDCIDIGDSVALAATLGRLMRAGEGSLTAIWDLQDITI